MDTEVITPEDALQIFSAVAQMATATDAMLTQPTPSRRELVARFDMCLTRDCDLAFGQHGAATGVDGYIQSSVNLQPKLTVTQHFMGAPVLHRADGVVTSTSHFIATHLLAELSPDGLYVIGGTYRDELISDGSRWRICKRRTTQLWSNGNPSVLGTNLVPPA